MIFVIGVLSSVSPGEARAASAPLPIARGRDGTPRCRLLERVWPFSASCAAHRSEVALHALAVEIPRLHDDQRPNGVLGDERQVEQYIARLLGRFRPDGGVGVRSAQPLGKTQRVRLL